VSTAPSRTIEQSEHVVSHLAGCFDGLYRGLGTIAPRCSDDGHVVLAYELARAFGTQRHAFATLGAHRAGVEPEAVEVPIIGAVLRRAHDHDPSGTLVLVAVSSVVGPRLLISLRDAAESASAAAEGPLRLVVHGARQCVIESMARIGTSAREVAPSPEGLWRSEVNELDQLVSQAGYGESLGLG
jgi:hypothetical protein